MKSRRAAAIAALALSAAGLLVTLFTSTRSFPRGLIAAAVLVLAGASAWHALLRRGRARQVLAILSVLLLIGFVVALLAGGILLEAIVAAVLFALAAVAARTAFRIHVPLEPAPAPAHPVVVWNPKSGGGKALAANLDAEARARGIEPIELRPGDDLIELVRTAVANGADALAAAGGDGTQALVATIAAELDLPFACIPAGTRNHFALDLGVNRDDVVGALDAFVNGGERRVDLAEVNGRVFVNNVSLGLYAEAVQRSGYRDAKIRTVTRHDPRVQQHRHRRPRVGVHRTRWCPRTSSHRHHGVEQLLPPRHGHRIRYPTEHRRRRTRHRRCRGDLEGSSRPVTVPAVDGDIVRGRLRRASTCRCRR